MPAQVPSSIEAEAALLGSMLLYPDTIRLAFEEDVQPSDFFVDSNKKIYNVISDLNSEGKPTDVTSVITRLTDLQILNQVGGADYILHLADVAISSANCEYYITSIKEKSLLRKLIEVSETIKMKSFEGQYDAFEVLNEAESLILKVSRERKTSEFKTSKETFEQLIENITYLQQHHEMTGVPSGFKYLDNITNGFQKSDLIILAARPSVGKTAFALNLASNAATRHNKNVAIFSLEMPAVQLASRMLAAKSTVDSNKLRTGKGITNDDWAKIDEARNMLQNSGLFIDDSSTIKVNDIFAKCRKLKEDQGLDMIIIDYLQLIQPSTSKGDNRQLEVSEISRQLKQMARELDVPVIALSQLSRSVEKNKGEPMLSDLRESGAIEQDADIVMFLHRVKKEEKEAEEEQAEANPLQEIKIIIAKHRNGAIGKLPLAFEGRINAFYTKEFDRDNYD